MKLSPDDDKATEADAEVSKREQEFGEAVRLQRIARQLTVADAARLAGIAPNTWSRIEDGRPVRKLTWPKVDDVFKVPAGTMAKAHADLNTDLDAVFARARWRATPQDETSAQILGRELAEGRSEQSDQQLMTQLIMRLSPFAGDATIDGLLGELVKLAYGRQLHGREIFDQDGNIALAPLNRFAKATDIARKEDKPDAKHGETAER